MEGRIMATPIIQYSLGPADLVGTSHLLPSGYQAVAWVESSGTQYIDLGLVPQVGDKIQFEIVAPSSFSTEQALTGTLSGNRFRINIYSSKFLFQVGNSANQFSTVLPEVNGRYYIYYDSATDNQSLTINGVKTSVSVSSGNGSGNYFIFGTSNGTSVSNYGAFKLNMYRLWRGNTLVRDLQPALYGTTPGMYDYVNQKFYTNSGSGSFSYGPPLANGQAASGSIPQEYQQVEWLEGDGTQWINTGINLASTHTYEGMLSNYSGPIFGYRSVTSATASGNMMWSFIYTDGKVALRYGQNGDNSTSTVPSTPYIFKFDGTYVKINGTNYITKTAYTGTYTSAYAYLFKANTDGYYGSDISASAGRIHYWKVWNGSTLVAAFYPCYRRSDLTPGMYDTVRKTFYTNSGSGSFLLGPSITPFMGGVGNGAGNPNAYGMIERTLTDGSRWARIFWHDVYDSSTRTWCTTSNAGNVHCNTIQSWMDHVDEFVMNGKYEFMLTYPRLNSTLYNRWTQTSSPNASSVTGFTAVTTAWTNYNKGIAKSATSSTVWNCNGGSSGWYGAIGQVAAWTNNSMPAANGTQQYETELWVRVPYYPALPTSLSTVWDGEKEGYVADFKSTGSMLDVGQPGIESMFNTRTWSVALRFKMDSKPASDATTVWRQLFVYRKSGDTTATHQLSIHVGSSGIGTSFWSDDYMFTVPSFAASKWYNAVITQNGATQTLYVNGSKIGTTSKGTLALQSGSQMSIGYNPTRSSDAPRQFLGQITNVQVFDTCLSDADALALTY